MADSNTTGNATQAANATPQGNAAEGSTNLTLAHLNLMSSAILVAQKRGTFSLEESAVLVEPVKLVSELVKKSNEQSQNTAKSEQEEKSETSDNNTANATSSNVDPKLVVE